MIIRRNSRGNHLKHHINLFKLHQLFGKYHDVTIPEVFVEQYLCPRIRAMDWKIYTVNGHEDMERWIRNNGKGTYISCVTGDVEYLDTSFGFMGPARFSFTDRNTALMFKLTLGGR